MDSRGKIFRAVILASLCAASVAVPPAIGCGFHAPLGAKLESMYPGSFPVAVALRKAADTGVIAAAALEAQRTPAALLFETMPRLQRFGKALAASPLVAELPASFSLGYVESSLWTRYSQSDGKVGVNIHIDGPVKGEAVVLTGEPVLMEILAGRLSIDHALADGIILIYGNDSEKSAIRRALIAVSKSDGPATHSLTARSASTSTLTVQSKGRQSCSPARRC